jgi:hypothetical protein
MTRHRITIKASHCEGCQKEFNKDFPYHSRNMCNPCYQREYNQKKNEPKKINSVVACIICNLNFGSLNHKGKLVRKGAQNHCKHCYANIFNKLKSSTCKGCGNEMITPRLSLCPVCKQNEMGSKRWKRKKRSPHIIDDREIIEMIRRLLVRFKYGTNTQVDALRVIDVYLDISDNTNLLDNFREDYQLIEMLRWLKLTYDYNIDLLNKRKEAERIKQERWNKIALKKEEKKQKVLLRKEEMNKKEQI